MTENHMWSLPISAQHTHDISLVFHSAGEHIVHGVDPDGVQRPIDVVGVGAGIKRRYRVTGCSRVMVEGVDGLIPIITGSSAVVREFDPDTGPGSKVHKLADYDPLKLSADQSFLGMLQSVLDIKSGVSDNDDDLEFVDVDQGLDFGNGYMEEENIGYGYRDVAEDDRSRKGGSGSSNEDRGRDEGSSGSSGKDEGADEEIEA